MSNFFINDNTCTDPWRNLAAEECLLSGCGEGDAMLYLWQNASTVVIGRHQNPWKECRAELLAQEGGKLARRITGGGAVFHDLGNLNFSFVMGRHVYDVPRHLEVVLSAVKALGIEAEFSGRNDLLTGGRKFSGNAFARRQNASLHHGTLLVDVDMGRLGRYLQPPRSKMESKGIQSVQSRVVNLSELSSDVTVASLRLALADAFRACYGSFAQAEAADLADPEQFLQCQQRQASWEWRFGQTPRFDVSLENRFPWGGVELQLAARDGCVAQAQAFSDAMDEEFISALSEALSGVPFSPEGMAGRLKAFGRPEANDLAEWLGGLEF